MALGPDSELETASFVLTKDQVRRLRALRDLRKSDHQRVTLSDVAREVVNEGLDAVSRAPNIALTASREEGEAA
ncbi:MAG: hypothetical protein MOGMAGMI_02301 [Candidatus Omnitrophica bacterium]|nr:hypothetical protein [Candidatus Omnitrophota bacterium]